MKKHWFSDPTTLFNFFVALFTLLLTIIALIQAWSYIKTERAFVLHQDFAVIGFQDVQNHNALTYRIAPIWVNVGETPTRDMTIYASSLRSFDKSHTYDFTIPNNTKFTPIYLGPKATIEGSPSLISGQELLDIRAGKNTYYIWGWASYRDVFSNLPWNTIHITRFCEIIDSIYGDPSNPTSDIRIGTSSCPTYNCADEECKRQDQEAAKP
jgi:hypothetical protein